MGVSAWFSVCEILCLDGFSSSTMMSAQGIDVGRPEGQKFVIPLFYLLIHAKKLSHPFLRTLSLVDTLVTILIIDSPSTSIRSTPNTQQLMMKLS